MALIHRAGDSMIFRQNTSTPGGTVWPIAAHSIAQNLPITIVAHVTVSITGANQALFSLGTAAARMLEVGVDGTGQPYAWGSGAQVILGAALTAGSHVLAFIVSEGGTVSVLADIDYFGLGTVTMGTAVSRACAGVSCLGTLPWSGTYSDVRVYASEDEEAAAGAMGLAGRAPYSIANVPNIVAWWRLDVGVTTVDDGGTLKVASIADQSGVSGVAMSQTVMGNRPVYEPAGFNGRPCFNTDLSNMWMDANGVAAYFSGSDKPFSFYLVVQMLTAVNNSPVLHFFDSGGGTGILKSPFYTSAGTVFRVLKTTDTGTNRQYSVNLLTLGTHVFWLKGSGNVWCGINSSETITNENFTGTATLDSLQICAANGATPFRGRFAEAAIFNADVSATDHALILADLKARWGTP